MAEMLALRQALRPYTRSLYLEHAATGVPIMRPLFLEFPWDARLAASAATRFAALALADVFMYGPRWLVKPVIQEKTTSDTVYLPLLPPSGGYVWSFYFNRSRVERTGGVNVTTFVSTATFNLWELIPPGEEPLVLRPKKTWADWQFGDFLS